MAEHKSTQELAAEITIAALQSSSQNYVQRPDIVVNFYRQVLNELNMPVDMH